MRVTVEADGGSRGNPGPAGYGAVVRGEGGEVLAERLAACGVTTNNVAEYSGLIAGLTAAAELGASTVDVRMDSKLVVEQMSGRWRVKHPALQPLVARARELVGAFEAVGFEWIPRARNGHADRLANEAMDAAAEGRPVRDGDTAGEQDQDEQDQDERVASAAVVGSWLGTDGAPTRLLLLRHGQTELSVQRRYSGRGNPELTEAGTRQAKAAAARLAAGERVDAIVSSPLRRARQTAEAAGSALGLTPLVHDGLIEADFGAWEGLTFAEAAERDPQTHRRWLADPTEPIPGGESLEAVQRRTRAVRAELLAAHQEQTVLVVTHVTPIKSLLRMALDAPSTMFFRLHLDLASLSIVDYYPDGRCSVRLVNDTSHLA